jgi:hypothetical protein
LGHHGRNSCVSPNLHHCGAVVRGGVRGHPVAAQEEIGYISGTITAQATGDGRRANHEQRLRPGVRDPDGCPLAGNPLAYITVSAFGVGQLTLPTGKLFWNGKFRLPWRA